MFTCTILLIHVEYHISLIMLDHYQACIYIFKMRRHSFRYFDVFIGTLIYQAHVGGGGLGSARAGGALPRPGTEGMPSAQ